MTAGASDIVAGVDGCRRGWVVASGPARRTGGIDIRVIADIAPVIEDVEGGELALVGIDIPIGLPDGGNRRCDVEARRLVGARRSSVFPAPPRAALTATTYAEALELARGTTGIGLSQQTFRLIPKIREVDELLSPDLSDRVIEVHPEGVFAALLGRPLASPKRTAEGRRLRTQLLLGSIPTLDGAPETPTGASADDVLDALAVLVCARAHVAGRTTRLGDGSCDRRELLMQIVTLAPVLN